MGDGVVAETGAANYLFWPLLSKQRLQALDPEVRETLEVASKGHLSRVAKVPVWAQFAAGFKKLSENE